MAGEPTPPPSMAGWNLALRFGLELAALFGLGLAAWSLTSGVVRWVVVVSVPVVAATAWATFNVVDDPSRSGRAPVEVPGFVRLVIELVVLGAGAIGLGVGGLPVPAVIVAAMTALHYAFSLNRVRWLLGSGT